MEQSVTVSTPRAQPIRPKRQSLRDQAYETIKSRIVSCVLRPGESITVTQLADDLALGRTPIIQALDRLMVDGLVQVMPRKGVVVSPVSFDELVEIIDIRTLNECQAGRWAAERIRGNQIVQLQTNVDAMNGAMLQRDIDHMIALDREFHRLINLSAGNSIMTELLSNLHDRSVRFWTLSLNVADHNKRVVEQHVEIVRALAAHDPDLTEAAIRKHIAAFKVNLVENLLGR